MYTTYYLNNDGSRTVSIDEHGNHNRFILVREDGTRENRAVDYEFAFGNFSGIAFRMNGIRYSGLPESFPDDETGLPVVSHYSEIGKGVRK